MAESKQSLVEESGSGGSGLQMVKQVSKDGKIKSKNFNLFAQFNGTSDPKKAGGKQKNSAKAVSSAGESSSNSEGEEEEQSDDEDARSEKLRKQIADSINSYSLEKASS